MRPYYSDYVSRALRCWARGITPASEADVLARQGVIRALAHFPEGEARILQVLYSAKKPFVRALCDYAALHSYPERRLWELARGIERRVAKECGIL